MLHKVLIANRGEVALRVICACRELGLRTVAVFSEVDANASHVRYADEAVCIGPAAPARSYLNTQAILSAAELTRADAVHPGYGFLSESPEFAESAIAAGFIFVGPPPDLMRLLGDKSRARHVMQAAGLSVLPGTKTPPETTDDAVASARRIGYPLMLKAAGGGGGRGVRILKTEADLIRGWGTAQREAEASCGDRRLYLEGYLSPARHIEVQILADGAGHVVHLGERECSLQRRHQKLVEETPSVALTLSERDRLATCVVDAARSVAYRGAGTFEFLMNADRKLFFLEVNPRLQVEHAVSEMVTGIDIVKEQIRIASGDPLSIQQEDIQIHGHALECRITAETPDTFRPSSGVLSIVRFPGGPGVRVDSAIHAGAAVPPDYDPLIAKLVTCGRDRDEAIARMRRALDMTVIEGVETTIPLHRRIMADTDFQAGRLSTDFVRRLRSVPVAGPRPAPNQ